MSISDIYDVDELHYRLRRERRTLAHYEAQAKAATEAGEEPLVVSNMACAQAARERSKEIRSQIARAHRKAKSAFEGNLTT